MKKVTHPQITVNVIEVQAMTALPSMPTGDYLIRLRLEELPNESELVTPSVKTTAIQNIFIDCGSELLTDIINDGETDDQRVDQLHQLIKWARAYLQEAEQYNGRVTRTLDRIAPHMMITALNLMY